LMYVINHLWDKKKVVENTEVGVQLMPA
jgi:hypothetical protein